MIEQYNRIEKLEQALEALLECFDRGGTGNPWIEVEAEMDFDQTADALAGGIVILEGQVNQLTADAIERAEEVLYQDDSEDYDDLLT